MRAGSNGHGQTLASQLAMLLGEAAAAEEAVLATELASIPDRIGDLSRRLVALDRSMPRASKRLRELRQLSSTEAARRAGEELERIQGVAGVHHAEIEGSALVVFTAPIVVASRALGAYRIAIRLDGDVRIESLDRLGPRPAWDHPHVQAGLPCLGNLRPGVLKLVSELELGLAVQVLLDFLRTYEAETAYTPIDGWPPA
jgi:hypothetical protein